MPTPTRPSESPVVFGANATRTSPDPYEQEHGYQSGIPVPTAGHNWLFWGLTSWWSATAELLSENLWNWIGAPVFTGTAIRRSRRFAVNAWKQTSTTTVSYGLDNAYVAAVGDGATLQLAFDLATVLPDEASLVSLQLVYDRTEASGEEIYFGLDTTTTLGVTTVVDELRETDEAVVSGNIRTLTMTVSDSYDYSAEFLRVRLTAINGTPAGQGIELMSCFVVYDLPSLVKSL